MIKKILITGSTGLVGTTAVKFFCSQGFQVHGIDNNMRAKLFGPQASTKPAIKTLSKIPNYFHHNFDIRNQAKLKKLFKSHKFHLIIHAAGQPSHDWAKKDPSTDFSINALATQYLLENFRTYSPHASFIFLSTNKVYGDLPNKLPFLKLKTRYELAKNHHFYQGINESMSLDQSTHSLMGASKLAADILVQEYGRYFHLNTVSFRCGCLTGPDHAGVPQHGFLSNLVKTIKLKKPYTIFGYQGKQVRDNLHADDLIQAFYQYFLHPKPGQVYNLGGSRFSHTSILEAIKLIETKLNLKAKIKYSPKARIGDHLWYISDVSKFKKDYPQWQITYNIKKIIHQLCLA